MIATMNFTAPTLAKLATRDKAASTLAEAKRRALDTQAALEVSESAYAVVAADAFTAGTATPAIPKDLVALRAADDLADSVVAVLEPRAAEQKRDAENAAESEIVALIDTRCASDATAAHAALKAMGIAWCKLQLAAPRIALTLGQTLAGLQRTDLLARADSTADLRALCERAGIDPALVRADSNILGDARARHPLPCIDDAVAAVRTANV